MEKARITVERMNADDVVFHIEALDPSVETHEATFELTRRVFVRDSRGINDREVLFRQGVRWDSGRAEIRVKLSRFQAYSYSGQHIEVLLEAELRIDDGLIFDTKIDGEYDLPLANRPHASENAHHIIDPEDIYSFFDNFSALPGYSQANIVAVLMLLGIAGLVVIGLAVAQGNLFGVMFLLCIVVVSYWLIYKWLVKDFLRGYLERDGELYREPIVRGEAVRMDLLVDARATVPIDELTVRVVAANLECGQYRRGYGTDVRTVSFRNPVRGLVLYERTIRDIAQGDSIADHLKGDLIYFDEMFDVLYPPNSITSTHGLDMVWEIQLLHDNFVDHEIRGVNNVFRFSNFLTDDLHEAAAEPESVW